MRCVTLDALCIATLQTSLVCLKCTNILQLLSVYLNMLGCEQQDGDVRQLMRQ